MRATTTGRILRGNLSILVLTSVLVVVNLECANDKRIAAHSFQVKEAIKQGKLCGKVTRGPLSPAKRKGEPISSEPVSALKLVILPVSGRETMTVVTDKDGRYSISLPEGTYRIEMVPVNAAGWTKDLPTVVTINERQETQLDIRIDTGIR